MLQKLNYLESLVLRCKKVIFIRNLRKCIFSFYLDFVFFIMFPVLEKNILIKQQMDLRDTGLGTYTSNHLRIITLGSKFNSEIRILSCEGVTGGFPPPMKARKYNLVTMSV